MYQYSANIQDFRHRASNLKFSIVTCLVYMANLTETMDYALITTLLGFPHTKNKMFCATIHSKF
jgi:hypothetical protein